MKKWNVFLPISGPAIRSFKKSRRSSRRYDEMCSRASAGSVCKDGASLVDAVV